MTQYSNMCRTCGNTFLSIDDKPSEAACPFCTGVMISPTMVNSMMRTGDLPRNDIINQSSWDILYAHKQAADARVHSLVLLIGKMLLKLGVLPNENARPMAELIDGAQDWLKNARDAQGRSATKLCDPPCPMRLKIKLAVAANLTEAQCGVSDAETADFWSPDKKGLFGHPVIQIRYCPWCGKLIGNVLTSVTDIAHKKPNEIELEKRWCTTCGTEVLTDKSHEGQVKCSKCLEHEGNNP